MTSMNDQLTPDELKKFYASLPEDLQNAIFSPETMDTYNQIQERYALDAEQREELSIQSGLLMMGITEPKEYVLVLAEKLGIPRDKAAFIAQEVNRNILHPVRESLKEIHAPVVSESDTLAPETVSPPPPAIPPAPPSTFDQKLGSAFRVPAPPQANVPNYSEPSAPPPTPIVPPPPPTVPSAPRARDPYREPPL